MQLFVRDIAKKNAEAVAAQLLKDSVVCDYLSTLLDIQDLQLIASCMALISQVKNASALRLARNGVDIEKYLDIQKR